MSAWRDKYRTPSQERQGYFPKRTVLKLGTRMKTIDLEGAEEKRKLKVHPFSYPGGSF